MLLSGPSRRPLRSETQTTLVQPRRQRRDLFADLFAVFLYLQALLIVVSVSTPIWNSVYFLEATFNNARDTSIRLGQWGACAGGACTATKLGYNLDFITNAFPDNQVNLSETVVRGLTCELLVSALLRTGKLTVNFNTDALIVNPIAAGFSFLALCAAIFPNTFCGVLGSILSFWAFLVTLVALGVSLSVFRRRTLCCTATDVLLRFSRLPGHRN